MSTGIITSMKRIFDRYDDLCDRLSSEEVLTNPQLLSQVAKERSDLEAKVALFRRYEEIAKQLDEVKQLVSEETDPEMLELAREENETLENELHELEENIKFMLLPADPLDGKDIIMEIRAGTGGEEAALFASNLYRMYSHYADIKGWKSEVLPPPRIRCPTECWSKRPSYFSCSGCESRTSGDRDERHPDEPEKRRSAVGHGLACHAAPEPPDRA